MIIKVNPEQYRILCEWNNPQLVEGRSNNAKPQMSLADKKKKNKQAQRQQQPQVQQEQPKFNIEEPSYGNSWSEQERQTNDEVSQARQEMEKPNRMLMGKAKNALQGLGNKNSSQQQNYRTSLIPSDQLDDNRTYFYYPLFDETEVNLPNGKGVMTVLDRYDNGNFKVAIQTLDNYANPDNEEWGQGTTYLLAPQQMMEWFDFQEDITDKAQPLSGSGQRYVDYTNGEEEWKENENYEPIEVGDGDGDTQGNDDAQQNQDKEEQNNSVGNDSSIPINQLQVHRTYKYIDKTQPNTETNRGLITILKINKNGTFKVGIRSSGTNGAHSDCLFTAQQMEEVFNIQEDVTDSASAYQETSGGYNDHTKGTPQWVQNGSEQDKNNEENYQQNNNDNNVRQGKNPQATPTNRNKFNSKFPNKDWGKGVWYRTHWGNTVRNAEKEIINPTQKELRSRFSENPWYKPFHKKHYNQKGRDVANSVVKDVEQFYKNNNFQRNPYSNDSNFRQDTYDIENEILSEVLLNSIINECVNDVLNEWNWKNTVASAAIGAAGMFGANNANAQSSNTPVNQQWMQNYIDNGKEGTQQQRQNAMDAYADYMGNRTQNWEKSSSSDSPQMYQISNGSDTLTIYPEKQMLIYNGQQFACGSLAYDPSSKSYSFRCPGLNGGKFFEIKTQGNTAEVLMRQRGGITTPILQGNFLYK